MRIHSLRSDAVGVVLLGAAARAYPAGPPLSPEQKALDKFLGTWRTSYKVPKAEWTPEERHGTAELTYSRVLGGSFVQEKGEHSDKSSSILMYTYDTERKCYRGWWFSSTGQTAESTGKWDAEAKTFTWTSSGTQPFTTTSRHRFVNDNSFEWDVVVKDGKDKVLFRMEGKAARFKKE
jgi:hypothetical protein